MLRKTAFPTRNAGGIILALMLSHSLSASQETATWTGHGMPVLCVACSPDGGRVVSGDAGGEMRLWEAATGRQIGSWRAHDGPVTAAVFAPDGKRIYSGGDDGTIIVWGAEGKHIQDWSAHSAAVVALAFSADGRLLASGGRDAQRKIWNVAQGGLAAQWKKREEASVLTAAFSADGKSVLFGSDDGTLRVCGLSKKETESAPPCDVLKFEGCGRTLPFPDGGRVVSACANGDIVRWDLGTGKDRVTAKGGGARVNSIALSPDGRLLVSGGEDEIVRLWDAGAMKPVANWRGHRGPVTAVAFSPDGRTTFSAGEDRVVKSWDVAGELACAEKFAAGRSLLEAGSQALARRSFEEAVACRPANIDYQNWLGSACHDLGEHAKAVETLKKAELQSRRDVWNYYLARSYMALGRFQEAKAALSEGLNESPLNNRGIDRRGEIRGLMDKVEAYQTHLGAANAGMTEGRFADARAAAESALAQVETEQAKTLRDDAIRKLAAEARGLRNRWLVILVVLVAAAGGGWAWETRRRRAAKALADELERSSAPPQAAPPQAATPPPPK
ncbi:MAG: hypothetical protein HY748_05075 [Elusimicrobia bacterium]|nr:hypothetical protein [Elusimicrobiota bacterium]